MKRSRKRRAVALAVAAFVLLALLLGVYLWISGLTPPGARYETLVYQVWINTDSTGRNFSVLLPLPDKQEMWTMLYRVDAQSPAFDSAESVQFRHEVTSNGSLLRVTANGNVTLRAQYAYPGADTSTNLSFTSQEKDLVGAHVTPDPTLRIQTIVFFAGMRETGFGQSSWEYSGVSKTGIADEVYRNSYGGMADELLSKNEPMPLEDGWSKYRLSSGYFRTSLDLK